MTGVRRRLDARRHDGLRRRLVRLARRCSPSHRSSSQPSPGGFVDYTSRRVRRLIALGELVRITMPGGRDVAPIATAGALGYVLLTRYPDGPATQSALQVVAVVVVACSSGSLPHAVVGRRAVGRQPGPPTAQRRGRSRPSTARSGLDAAGEHARGRDPGLRHDRCRRRSRWRSTRCSPLRCAPAPTGRRSTPSLRNEIQAQAGIGSAIGATGALLALAASIMGSWALPVFVVPLLLTQFRSAGTPAIREYVPADHPGAVAGHRAGRLHRGRALPPGQPAVRRGRPRARHGASRPAATWSTPR